ERTTESAERQSTALETLTDDTDAQREAQDRLNRATRDAKREQDAYRAALQFNAQIVDELVTAHDALGTIAQQAETDLLNPIDDVLVQRDAQLQAIRDLEAVTGETAQSRAAAEAVLQRALRDERAITDEAANRDRDAALQRFADISNAAFTSADQVTDAIGSLVEIQLGGLEEAASRARSHLDATTARIAEVNLQLLEETDARIQAELALELGGLQAQQAAQAQALAERNERLTSAFNARKALEIGGALISGAAAAVAALAPPPAGLGPVAGPFLIPGIVATTGAQIATISAQQPPQFHTGFAGYTDAGDEFGVRLAGNETVNNARATEALGGAAGVDELNATGRLPTRSRRSPNPGELGRMLGRLLADELDAGRELSRTLHRGRPRPGVRPVFAR
ncbi:MAG: hypothetical protein AAF602_30065, partial [Myxococcota bacterium]